MRGTASPRGDVVRIASIVITLSLASAAHADPADIARRIDARLAAHFAAEKIQPAPTASDTEFLRRLTLDLTGRIPRVSDVHRFLADASPDKRRQAIDRLLDDPRFAIHFANVWRAELLPEASANRGAELFQAGFEAWLQSRFRARTNYDAMVRELIAVPIAAKDAEPVLRDPERSNPLAFFAAKDAKPENLAAAVSRSFLGIQLECAQCHDHPFAKWTREQFWSQAAFFAGIERQGGGLFAPLLETPGRGRLTSEKKTFAAVFLDGAVPEGKQFRGELAAWVTSKKNPYFAKAAVNRVWGQLFGFGIVDPVDDFRDDNPPSDAALLDDLAAAFIESDFNLADLIRGICLSQAYQRSSEVTHASQKETRLPARMPLKALTGEQFVDSLMLATGFQEARGNVRRQFLTRFALTGPIGEPETSVQQALMLRNGAFVKWATESSPTLIAARETPGLDRKQRIEMLYLATLSRSPTGEESERWIARLERGDIDLPDVFWVLLNSAEFRMNH